MVNDPGQARGYVPAVRRISVTDPGQARGYVAAATSSMRWVINAVQPVW